MDYDFFEKIGNRYDRIYSYGGIVDKSFWQNVGKTVNKQEIIEHKDLFEKMLGKADRILKGEKLDRS